MLSKWLVIAVIILSAIGLIISAYLGVNHYTTGSLSYDLTQYITIFGLPIALIAILYFLIFLMCGLLYFDTKNPTMRRTIFVLGILGIPGAIWTFYIQFFKLKIICGFHMILAGAAILLFILGLIFFLTKPRSTSTQ